MAEADTAAQAGGTRASDSAAPAVRRDGTLEDGLKQLMQTVDSLVELERRLNGLEEDVIGKSPVALEPLPSPRELGIDGLAPRLMEAALLIGALTRRMHLRVGVVEGGLGVRAKPVSQEAEDFAEAPELLEQTVRTALFDSRATTPSVPQTSDTPAASADSAQAVVAALADVKRALAARRAGRA